MIRKKNWLLIGIVLILILQGCNLPGPTTQPTATSNPPTDTAQPPATTPTLQHLDIPVFAPDSQPYPDVFSSDTAPEKRAPYGDSFDINRMERPFTQDMIYIPDIDISSISSSGDGTWVFVSIGLIGKNPNSQPGIQYSVELDTNLDSFGDFLIVAEPPYSEEWTAENIKIYSDTNHDTAGISASKSDAPFSGDGYDQLIQSISQGVVTDADLAWVRINAGPYATVQFAFKQSFSGASFLYSVMADAGLRDIARLDYVDYFTEVEAGSPVRDNLNYPLKALYAVDNTCFQAFGFKPTGFEPKICPVIVQPVISQPGEPASPGTTPPPSGCQDPGNCPWGWSGEPYCVCTPG